MRTGADAVVDCAAESSKPVAGITLLFMYCAFTVVLLLNLLIALFSKTFDTMHDKIVSIGQASLCHPCPAPSPAPVPYRTLALFLLAPRSVLGIVPSLA